MAVLNTMVLEKTLSKLMEVKNQYMLLLLWHQLVISNMVVKLFTLYILMPKRINLLTLLGHNL